MYKKLENIRLENNIDIMLMLRNKKVEAKKVKT